MVVMRITLYVMLVIWLSGAIFTDVLKHRSIEVIMEYLDIPISGSLASIPKKNNIKKAIVKVNVSKAMKQKTAIHVVDENSVKR